VDFEFLVDEKGPNNVRGNLPPKQRCERVPKMAFSSGKAIL
jgi:hypothetical protein